MLRFQTVFTAICLALALSACSGAMSPDGNAGENQTAVLGETIILDGTQSDKKNGEDLEYRWALVSAPEGSEAELSDPTAAQPTFTPDMVGEYVFELVVDNDYHESDPVQVTVSCISEGEVLPEEFTSDPSGEIVVWDFKAVENSRSATHVDFKLSYAIENTGENRAEIGFIVYGVDAEGNDVLTREITTTIDSGETRETSVDLGEALTIEEYDSITAWEADPITVSE